MSLRTPTRWPLPIAMCAALLTVSAGCSFVFVDGPPVNHKKLPFFTCTPSNTLPIVDLVIGGTLAASMMGQLDGGGSSTSDTTAVAVAIGEAALFGASAIYGFSKTSQCREANTELLARLPPNPGMGPGYPPGYVPGYPPPPPQAPYDPWLAPPPGAFAAPPQPAAAPPPAAAPVGPKAPATDSETPRPGAAKP